MQPAVFLDRDGTLNFDYGWITSPAQIELLPGAARAVRRINDHGYLAVLVTNQPVIARGECTPDDVDAIHRRLVELLEAEAGGHLDAIYYCPHHPGSGMKGERSEYTVPCDCRKPAPGLLRDAARDLDIDVARSWMVGDSERDLGAAAAFGIPAVLVSSNQKGFKTDAMSQCAYLAGSVAQAIEWILRQNGSA